MNNSVDIKSYTIGDIEGLLSDHKFWELDPLPITKHRIVSQMRNPRASKDDLALVAAFENGCIVGYRGVLPDRVYVDGISKKAGCLTTNWVDPGKRRQGISTSLRNVAMEAYDGLLYASEFTEAAKKSLDKSKMFTALEPMKANRVWVRFSILDMIPKRFGSIRLFAFIFSSVNILANFIVNARLNLWKAFNRLDGKFHVEYLAEIDHDTALFIKKYEQNGLVRRGARELDWITQYPWVIQAPFQDGNSAKYFFSSIAKSFSYLKFRILDPDGAIKAFFILRLRDRHLTIPYAYFDNTDVDMVTRILCNHIIELDALSLETCNLHLIDQIGRIRFPIVRKSTRDRHSVISNALARGDIASIMLQDGDGDKAFI